MRIINRNDFHISGMGIVFIVLGIGAILGAIGIWSSYREFKGIAIETEAVIADTETYHVYVSREYKQKYKVYAEYTVDGEKYIEEVDRYIYNPTARPGKSIKVLVNPKFPTYIRSAYGDWFYICLLGGVGLILIIIACTWCRD